MKQPGLSHTAWRHQQDIVPIDKMPDQDIRLFFPVAEILIRNHGRQDERVQGARLPGRKLRFCKNNENNKIMQDKLFILNNPQASYIKEATGSPLPLFRYWRNQRKLWPSAPEVTPPDGFQISNFIVMVT